MKRFLQEFKTFAMRGNVLDMAVGIIIGGAFTSIVNSLVNDVFTPVIGVITGGIDFSSLSFGVGGAQIMIGNFINAVISFLLVAFCVFILMKSVNTLTHKKAQEAAPPAKAADVVVLEEIRDLLKEKK